MTIRSITVAAIAAALLLGIILPMANAQAPPCFTFDGKIQTMQCPVSFRPTPVQYYSNAQSGFVQATDDELPSGFFDQQTINTLRENAAQTQNQSATQDPTDEQLLAQQQQLFEEQRGANQTALGTNLTTSDIEPVRSGLNTARQSLDQNDTQAAIESINRADGALFAIILDEGKGPLSEALTTLSDDIETTRVSVRNLDNEKAAADLNAADSQLVLITEMLPTEEPEPPEPPAQEQLRADENQSAELPFLKELPANQTVDTGIFPEQQQSPANQSETIPPMPEPQPEPAPAIQPQPVPVPVQQEPIIKVPLNKTQQELVTIEEIAGINKTTHEKTTISIIEGNKTTHRDVTTTEVPL